MTEVEAINTDGLAHVGEVTTRVFRESVAERDYTNALRAGRVDAMAEVAHWAQQRIDAAGPYDDTRALAELISWTADKIRDTHSTPVNGSDNA